MKRKIDNELLNWKKSSLRKPLLLQGARQVGKTYSLEEFGKKEFKNYHLFDFMEHPDLCEIFKQDLSPKRILRDLSIIYDHKIDAVKDLIIFDEIQQCPEALTSLKYFAKEQPNTFITSSGSLLGTELSSESFPVGNINRLRLNPMDFDEFLTALGEDKILEVLNSISFNDPLPEPIHQKIWTLFKYYMITGGLPDIVKHFLENIDSPSEGFTMVRKLQKELINDYIDDISKHSGKIKSVKIEAVFKNIPIQLARETQGVKKFVFKDVLPYASRYSSLEAPIEWLIKSGLIIKVPVCSKPQLPLKAYSDEKKFKLYMFDTGLLGCMLDLSPGTIFSYNYGSYKGFFAENIVLTELISEKNRTIYSWHRNTSEIEFLIEHNGKIIPIEVKAGINTKAKSLKVYIEKYSPVKTVLFSGRGKIYKNNSTIHLPLYMASKLYSII